MRVLKELFDKTRESIHSFLDELNIQEIENLLSIMEECPGLIVFSGVGKSGLVAKKIAMTMTSCGTRALFLSPTDALHGDLGIVTENDLLVLFSKSGESDELLTLIPAIRNKRVPVASLVCDAESRLAKASDFVLTLPQPKELCPFDMAPTTSTATQMIIGDVLAIALMQKKNFTLDDFADNHPAGQIGKRITLRVEDLMITDQQLPRCSPSTKLMDALVELSEKRCGCLLVTNEGQEFLGILTDGDLRRSLQKYGGEALHYEVEKLMTTEAKTTVPSDLAWKAMQIMEGNQKAAITTLPVLEKSKVVGLLRLHDVIQSGL